MLKILFYQQCLQLVCKLFYCDYNFNVFCISILNDKIVMVCIDCNGYMNLFLIGFFFFQMEIGFFKDGLSLYFLDVVSEFFFVLGKVNIF